jgi:hydrogenase-4 component B
VITVETLFVMAVSVPVAGAAVGVALRRRPALAHRLACAAVIAGSALGLVLAASALAAGAPHRFRFAGPVPGYPFTFLLDPLAGFFLGLVSVLAGLCAWYNLDYGLAGDPGPSLPMQTFCLSVLVSSMGTVVVANDVITFLAAWELMAVSTFLLVSYEHEKPEARRAAYIFLVASQVGTAFILAAFLGLAHHAGTIEFDAFRQARAMTPLARDLLFLMALVGFGTKAGLVPLHAWLPMAHPVAPSPVSALMSGVMIKTAIYGLVRFAFEFVRDLPGAWGLVVLAAGAVSAVLGVLFALLEHDLKRLLAYHSVENIGIITMGVGAALFLSGSGRPVAAGYALAAGLFHTANHGLFKTLLFLGAGAVLHATEERNMDELGGLLRAMPHTGALFLVGAMAICGFPPLNGFASEWMTYKALWTLSQSDHAWARPMGPLAAAALAAVGGLAASCFAKAFGITFLGVPRSARARAAREVPAGMVRPMAVLAALCLLLGLAPGALVPALARTLPASLSAGRDALARSPALSLPEVDPGTAAAMPLPLCAAFVLALGLAMAGFSIGWRLLGRRPSPPRTYGPWACGYPALAPSPPPQAAKDGVRDVHRDAAGRTQYTAASFSQPFAYLLRQFLSRRKHLELQGKRSEYLPERIVLRVQSRNPFESWVYKPLRRALVRLSWQVARLQAGSVQLYLGYMLGTVVLLLLLAP